MSCNDTKHNYEVVHKEVWEREGNYYRNLVVDYVIVCTKCGDSKTKREYVQGNPPRRNNE